MEVDAHLRFRGNSDAPLTHRPDWLAVPDGSTKATFEKLGFPGEQIVGCDNPNYDRVLDVRKQLIQTDLLGLRKRLLPKAPPGAPIVIFVAEHIDESEPHRMRRGPYYTLHGRGQRDNRTAIILQEVLDALTEYSPRPYIVLRLHPKNTREEFAPYLSEIDHLSAAATQ